MAESKRPTGLNLQVVEIESRTKPGCNTSSTHHLCTCPVFGPESSGNQSH